LAPAVPSIPDLLAASDLGRSSTDDITNVTTPVIRVEGTDANVTVDTLAPAVPSIPDLLAASDLGRSSTDDITSDATPDLLVAGEAGSTLTVFAGVSQVGQRVGDGAVTVSSLADGVHELTATATDAAGNAGAASAALDVTVDTAAPAAPATPDLLAASDSGSSDIDNITSDATPDVTVSGEADAILTVFAGAVQVGQRTGDGTITSSTLADGVHALTATATDVAGNTGAGSSALDVTVDTVAPAVLAAAPDLLAASDSGSSDADDITNVTTPQFAVAGAEAGSVVTLKEGVATLGSGAADGSGDATVTSSALGDGSHDVSATLTDAAGNTNAASPALTVTVDTLAPAVPSIPDLLAASDLGRSSTDDITNVTTPVIRVEGTDANVTVDLIKAASTLVTGTTSLAGLVDLTVPDVLADGAHAFTAVATDAAGNESAASPELTITVDTTAPAAPAAPDLVAASDTGASGTDNITNDATPDVTVSGEADAILTVLAGATQLGQRTGDGTITSSSLTDGTHTLTATATDVAGNTGAVSPALDVTVDTVAPTATLTPPTTLLGTAKVEFSEDVGSLQPGDVSIRLDAAHPAATRAAAPQTSTLIYDASNKRASLSLKNSLLPGEYYELVVAASPADVAGNVVAGTTQAFRGSVVEQEINSAGKHGWRIVGTSSSLALGGSYATERAGGARISMVFSGTEITWYTITGPGQGMAHVYIDGTYMGLFNNYASRNTYRVPRVFAGLSSTLHNILIIVDGRKGSSAASDTHVAVDAFAIRYPSGNRVTIVSPPLTYLWRIITDPNASGGRYVLSDQPGAAVAFIFRGTKFAWFPVFGPANGRARVFIDGVDKGVVDLYSASNRYGDLRFFGGLADGVHTVRIVALGQRSAASRGTIVATDRYAVG
ncbi:MAG TPA: Ig-like domain-containing protein, partial [Actinomycetota bacterium]